MGSNVFTSSRWGIASDRLAELEQVGVQVVYGEPLKGLPLPPVAYGETVVGEITGEEASVFRTLWDLKTEVETTDRAIQAEVFDRMSDAITGFDGGSDVVTVPGHEITECLGAGEREEYWRKRQIVGYLHTLFHYSLGERLGMHHIVLGLRSGGQIVKLGDR